MSLAKAGQRCDSVTAAIMTQPGSWRVTCAPGYVYGFSFDQKGGFVSAVRY
jgi:hypothetical protein